MIKKKVKKPTNQLSENDIDKLKEHSKVHGGLNSKHMRNMVRFMKSGLSFATAHKKAKTLEKPKMNIKPKKRVLKRY